MRDEPNRRRDLRERTTQVALDVIRLYADLPKSAAAAKVVGRQLLRSGTLVGAHYREAHRPRSTAEFISKMEGGAQELDEMDYWFELALRGQLAPAHRVTPLRAEGRELL